MQKTVYGIGLPRTGMTSLARALRILGFEGSNECRLTGSRDNDPPDTQERSFRIDNGYYEMYETLYDADPEGYFILTTRDPKFWRLSLSRFDHGLALPDIEDYERTVVSFFKDKKARLLVLNLLLQTDPWPDLCRFLDEPIPDAPFPHRVAVDHVGEGI